MSIEGQSHFLTLYFPGFVCTRPRYQVSVYRTIGPLVFFVTELRTKDKNLIIIIIIIDFIYRGLHI